MHVGLVLPGTLGPARILTPCPWAPQEIDKAIIKRFEVVQKLGKGVSDAQRGGVWSNTKNRSCITLSPQPSLATLSLPRSCSPGAAASCRGAKQQELLRCCQSLACSQQHRLWPCSVRTQRCADPCSMARGMRLSRASAAVCRSAQADHGPCCIACRPMASSGKRLTARRAKS